VTGYGFHPEALSDLDEIWEFIGQHDIDAADRVIGEILGSIESLETFPDRGHKRLDLAKSPIRFILVREYLIAYVPEEKPLWVLAVIHGRRRPHLMASVLRCRT